jgi:hypothetical protein
MLLLTSTSSLVRVNTASSGDIRVHASWLDVLSWAVTPGSTDTASISGTGNTTVVASPASSTARNVKNLTIFNVHATVSNLVYVEHYDGTTAEKLWSGTLQPGESVVMDDKGVWTPYTANGIPKGIVNPSGLFVKRTVLTSGTSFTTGLTTNTIFVRLLGAGGAGGGATSNAGNISCAGGGASGGYAEKTFVVTPNTAYTYQIGAGGAGGINGANAGNQGTNTFFVVGATNVVANGGPGGAAAPAAGATTTRLGGARPSQSTSGDLNASGVAGDNGFSVSVTIGWSGAGGASLMAGGGPSSNANGNGAAGVNFGSGGAGAVTVGAANATGGAGGQGVIIVDEFT